MFKINCIVGTLLWSTVVIIIINLNITVYTHYTAAIITYYININVERIIDRVSNEKT